MLQTFFFKFWFETDYIKSLSHPIPPDFCFYVPKSQNAPNDHFLLLQILVLGMTTKNLFPTEFLQTFVSGGRPEGSKRNLNFQSATWHHLKHFQRKAEGDQPVISVGAASWPG
jgi:hypothetical protein